MTVNPAQNVLLDINDERYRVVAREFMLRFVSAMALQLEMREGTAIDSPQLNVVDLDRLFTFSFALAATFEDQGGFLVEGDRYFAHVIFGTSPKAPDGLLGSWQRIALHGQLEDDLLTDALRQMP